MSKTALSPVIHVVDDDDAVRDALAFLLDTAGYRSETWASAEDFLAGLDSAAAGCVLTDVRMPGLNGLELVQRLNQLNFKCPVIVMTGHGDIPLAVEAMKAGVVDFLEKPLEDDRLLQAIETALSKVGDGPARAKEAQSKFATLSPRERDVLAGVVAGKPNKIIAFEHGISPRTVEVYRAGLMTKTGASSLSELVRMAVLAGF